MGVMEEVGVEMAEYPSGLSAAAFWRIALQQSKDRLPRQTDDSAEEAFWQDYAPGYDEKSPLAASAHEVIQDLCALVRESDHLLEIGAGPGAFTRRLASGLSRITVVEPSAAMRVEFARLWDGADIVETWPVKWEEAPDLLADVVFGANAFYRINDIAAALRKMDRLARSRVALVQTVGKPHANPLKVDLDSVSHERERADAMCDVLEEISIHYRRRDYNILRPTGPSRAALIDWTPR